MLKEVFDIIFIICAIIFLLTIVTLFVLFMIHKTNLIRSSLKNRDFKNMSKSNKINEYFDAVFHEPNSNRYFKEKFRVTFKKKEEFEYDEMIWTYITKLFYLLMLISLFTSLLMHLADYLELE